MKLDKAQKLIDGSDVDDTGYLVMFHDGRTNKEDYFPDDVSAGLDHDTAATMYNGFKAVKKGRYSNIRILPIKDVV